MSKFISLTTTSTQISLQSPQPPKPHQKSHPAYFLPTLSLTNEAENSSSTLTNVVIATPRYKEMRIAFAQFHVTQPFNRKNRILPRLTDDRTPFVTFFNPALPKLSSVVNKYSTRLQSTANHEMAFPDPPVIAYRRNASLRDLLVHSTLSHDKVFCQQPAGIKKCNHARCFTRIFPPRGSNKL